MLSSKKRVMKEAEHKTQTKTSKKTDGFNFNDLITELLVREPLLLYFICRRGSWVHHNSRGKKHPPLDPRGIINDREIDCKFFAKFQFNNNKKDSRLISVKPRKSWEKSMHSIPAKHCQLTKLGKKLYRHLKHRGMVQYIENNYSSRSGKDFLKNFAVKFDIQLPGDNEFVRETKNKRGGIDSHQQERKDKISHGKSHHKEFNRYKKPREIYKFSMTISSEVSRVIYNNIIKTYNFSANQILPLLSKEYQTIRDLIYISRITDNEQVIALKAKLIELTNLKIIEEEIISGVKAWRLKNN